MAKKKDQVQESAASQDPAGAEMASAQEANLSKEGEAPKAAPGPEKRPEGIAIGRIVHFYREDNSGFGVKVTAFPAMIIGLPPATSNFQEKDGAVDLKVFTYHGDEIRKGVMFAHSKEKRPMRWSFPEKV